MDPITGPSGFKDPSPHRGGCTWDSAVGASSVKSIHVIAWLCPQTVFPCRRPVLPQRLLLYKVDGERATLSIALAAQHKLALPPDPAAATLLCLGFCCQPTQRHKGTAAQLPTKPRRGHFILICHLLLHPPGAPLLLLRQEPGPVLCIYPFPGLNGLLGRHVRFPVGPTQNTQIGVVH